MSNNTNLAASNLTKWDAALRNFESDIITIDLQTLGAKIYGLIHDVGQLHTVTIGDLKVCGDANGVAPADMTSAIMNGTKFFDAMYYFTLSNEARPAVLPVAPPGGTRDAAILMVKKRLLWTAIFLMLRGSYPSAAGTTLGTDVPAFLVNICGMNESPLACATALSSFPLVNVKADWIRAIQWSTFAPEIRQRMALGLAGYRQLGPFRLYNCQPTASAEVLTAFNWVRHITTLPPSYSILSVTRSADMISKMGSWNKALANLMLLCFTLGELTEMVTNKIIYAMPVRDPRADTWKTWAAGGAFAADDPIGL